MMETQQYDLFSEIELCQYFHNNYQKHMQYQRGQSIFYFHQQTG